MRKISLGMLAGWAFGRQPWWHAPHTHLHTSLCALRHQLMALSNLENGCSDGSHLQGHP